MSVVLHLGVVDVPYAHLVPQTTKRVSHRVARGNGKDKAPTTKVNGPSGSETTGDVAEILEDQYTVMECFWTKHGDEIKALMEDDMVASLQAMMDGNPVGDVPFAEAMSRAERLFADFLNTSEMLEVLGSGPGTGAARRGVNHRFKHPYAKGNPSRPPFIDTGLYQASFRAWVEGKWSR